MHRSTLDSVFNLGTLLTRQGPEEYSLALVMYERAWKGYEVTLGCWHEETLNAIHHLGHHEYYCLFVCMYVCMYVLSHPHRHPPTHPFSNPVSTHFLSPTQT